MVGGLHGILYDVLCCGCWVVCCGASCDVVLRCVVSVVSRYYVVYVVSKD